MKRQLLMAAGLVAGMPWAFGADFITNTPEGEMKSYVRSSMSYISFVMYEEITEETGSKVDFVYGTDGYVYMNYPMGNLNTQGWLKGVREGNDIIFEFPQPIYEQDGEVYDAYVFDYDEFDGGFVVADTQEYIFNVNGDEIVSEVEGDWRILGLGMDLDGYIDWAGFGDFDYSMTLFKGVESEPSANLQTETYSFIHDDMGCFVNVGFTDNGEIWLQGLSQASPEGWLKGRVEGDKALFASGQYVGVLNELNNIPHYGYVYGGGGNIERPKEAADLVFAIDRESKVLTGENTLIINRGEIDYPYVYQFVENPILRYQEDAYQAATPAPASNVRFTGAGECTLDFNLTQLNDHGGLIDEKDLYYRIYVDGQLYTFTSDEYVYLGVESLTDIPFGFTDFWDIMLFKNMREITLYLYGDEMVGVQTVCKAGGEERVSAIVYDPVGVEKTIDTAEVVATEYYDLAGFRVATPSNGMYIRRDRLSDGNINVTKVCRK